MSTPTDALLDRARAGDEEALAELLRRFGPGLRRSLAGAIPARWQALLSTDDVLQQTYTDAFLAISSFRPAGPDAVSAWLKRLAHNNLRDALRILEAEKRGGRPPPGLTEEQSCERLVERLAADTGSTPSRAAARDERARILLDTLERLPGPYRQVIREVDLRGRSIEAVAAELGRSPGAAYLLRHRAHASLAGLLGSPGRFFSESP